MSTREVFARRRAAYMEAIGTGGVAVLRSPPEPAGGLHVRFRQSSDLYYLTGFREPETTMVLRPGADKEFLLFVRPRDREREVWDGRRAGVEGAIADYGADAAFVTGDLYRRLPDLIANTDDLYYGLGIDPGFDRTIIRTLADLRATERRGKRPPRRLVDPRVVLHEMRLRKSSEEIDILRQAAAITAEAHVAAMAAAGPGVPEYKLEAILDYVFRSRGGAGPGYNTIVGSGENATILHYVENDRLMQDGELVVVDAGCEYEFYTADVTRTFPVSGTFSPIQKQLYQLVLEAEMAAIAAAKPGVTIDDLHALSVEHLTKGMVEVGLLQGPAKARIADGSYRRFYMHRTSHWLGMDVHDVGAYLGPEGRARPLEAGMVITIEPGLYIAADAEGVADEMRGIGIRIEDDVLITDSGCDVLTAAVPKSVEDVEKACQGSGGQGVPS